MYPIMIAVFLSLMTITFMSVSSDLSFVGEKYKSEIIHNEYIMANKILDRYISNENDIFSNQDEFIEQIDAFTKNNWNNRVQYAVSNEFSNPTKKWEYKKAILFADLTGDFIGTNYFLSDANNGCSGSGGFSTNKDWCPKGNGNQKNDDTSDVVWTIYDLQQTYIDKEDAALNQADNTIYKIAHSYNTRNELPFGFTNTREMDAGTSKETFGESEFLEIKEKNVGLNAEYTWSIDSGGDRKSIPFTRHDIYFGDNESPNAINIERYAVSESDKDIDVVNVVVDTGIKHTDGTNIKKNRNITIPN